MNKQKNYLTLLVGIVIGISLVVTAMTFFPGEGEKTNTGEQGLHQQEEKRNTHAEDTHAEDTHAQDTHAPDTHAEDTHAVDTHTEDGAAEHDEHEDRVVLEADVMEELGIVTRRAAGATIREELKLIGEIVVDPKRLAHIVPRYPGIVKKVFKQTGDKVSEGEVIAVIESNESLVDYEVKASIEGVILEMHMTPGESVGDDNHRVIIADLDRVWAELQVYQEDLARVRTGQTARIHSSNTEDAQQARIFYLSPTLDKHTRTAAARVELPSRDGRWKPGMFVTANVTVNEREVDIAVPGYAVQNLHGSKVVFVSDGEGFEPTVVTTGLMDGELVQITSGLSAGQVYAAAGAFVIKSELLKESFGGGHNH